jgi:hypothetical protein
LSEPERARLIPISGIKGQTEAEDRATSALLAVLSVVRPFSMALLGPLGATRAKSARVETFIQPVIEVDDGTVRPDGLIRVSVGKRVSYEAFVETKTGTARLDAAQINTYLEAARAAGVDAIVTISNEIAPAPGVHPTEGLRVRSNSKVAVHHLSWMLIMSEAVKEHAHRGVDDPEQAWILEELIRYMSHPKSGVLDFADMGDNWTAVRDGAVDGSLSRNSPEAVEVCQRWDQLLRVAALRLGTEIGSDVTEVIPRAQQQNPRLRSKEFVQSLCADGTLTGVLRVPDAIADISVTADIRTSRVILQTAFGAPTDRTPRAAVVWLTKQLKAADGSLLVDAYARNAKYAVTASLEELRDDPRIGLGSSKQVPARFRLRYLAPMGQGRRSTRKKGFIDSVLDAVIGFYGDVLQDLKPFVPSAPAIDRRNVPAKAADTPNSPPQSSGGAGAAIPTDASSA